MYEWETSVVVVVNAADEVLLVRQDYGYRFFGLPGGKIENGESPAEAAIRELFEETGLRTDDVKPHSVHDLVYPGTGSPYRAHAFRCDRVTGVVNVQMTDEISSAGWYALNDLPSPLTPSAQAVLSSRALTATREVR